jgi:hypothetical protein
MSDADPSRRRKPAAPSQRSTPRFEARQQPLPPPPRPFAKVVDFAEDHPELRPRVVRPRRFSSVGEDQGAEQQQPAPPRPSAGEQLAAPALPLRRPISEATIDLHRAELLAARPARSRPLLPLPEARSSRLEGFWGHPALILLVGAICLVIYLLASAPSRVVFSNYTNLGGAASNSVSAALAPNGEHSVLGAPTISAEDVEAVLRNYHSPAAGTGQAWIEMGQKYGIDPAYALAFFVHESTAGTNAGWAGLKPGGGSTHNIGNIICAGYATCFGRFRDYPSWQEGIEDWYKLIFNEYVNGRSASTVEQIVPIYAPASDHNDVANYVGVVLKMVDEWRRQGVGR